MNFIKFCRKTLGVFIILIHIACQNQPPMTGGNVVKLTDTILTSKTKKLIGEIIKFENGPKLGLLTDFYQLKEEIYFFEQNLQDDYFGALVSIDQKQVLRMIGTKGKGPLELVTYFDSYKSRDSLYFFDYMARKLVVTDLKIVDDSNQISPENSREYQIQPSFPIDILLFIDNKWITKNYDFQHPDSSLVEVEPNTLKPIRYFGKLPDYATGKERDKRIRLVENLTNGAVKPDGEKFVMAYKFKDLIEVFDKNGHLEMSIIGPTDNFPQLSESTIQRFDPIPVYNKTWYAYAKVVSTETGFYVGYVGKKEPPASMYSDDGLIDEAYNPSRYSCILYFNWEGELIKRYMLDQYIGSFEISEQDQVIYGRGYLDEGILRFEY